MTKTLTAKTINAMLAYECHLRTVYMDIPISRGSILFREELRLYQNWHERTHGFKPDVRLPV